MACADNPCFGCSFHDYDHYYGEHWCNNPSLCERGGRCRRNESNIVEMKSYGGLN